MSEETKNSAENTGADTPNVSKEAEEMKALKAENKALKAAQKEQDDLIQELQAELEKSETTKGGSVPVFELKKDKYQVVIPKFKHKGKTYTAADVLENKDLQAELVKSGSGVVSLLS